MNPLHFKLIPVELDLTNFSIDTPPSQKKTFFNLNPTLP